MEKNELSRIPDSDVVVSPNNPDDPNDPVVTTDDPNDPATDAARRRNIEMEKDEQSRIPDPDGPDIADDPNDPVVTTDDPNICALVTNTSKEIRSTCDFVTNTLKEIRAELEKSTYVSGRFRSGSSIKSTYASSFSSRSSIPDPNDPVEPTDEQSGYDSDEAPVPFDIALALPPSFKDRPAPSEVHFELGSSSSMHDTKIEIKELEKFLGAAYNLKDIHVPVLLWCIYKVPTELRKIKEKAYTPQVISIGPLHHGNKALVEMEKQKLIYISEFQKREGGDEKLMRYKKFVQDNVQLIRNYYKENSALSNPKFVNMILRDAVFIFEFFLKNEQKQREFDYFLDTAFLKAAIACDLQLLENQLPYSILKKLFEEGAFPDFTKNDPDHDPFLILSHRFFFPPKDGNFPKPKNKIQKYEIQHFTDLRRYFLLMDFLPQYHEQGGHVKDLPTATKLHASGVKFKKGIEGRSSREISCKPVPRTMQIPGFKGFEIRIPFTKTLELQIPRLEIDDQSECLYRNMMALELCHYPSETHICDFIVLMDYLINTEKDVDLLVEKEIIFSMLGDNATVAKMFNNLYLQITPSFSVYHYIGEKLKAHYASNRWVRRWNEGMETLKTVYFGDIWTGTKTVAAVILLVLTFIQTVYSIL